MSDGGTEVSERNWSALVRTGLHWSTHAPIPPPTAPFVDGAWRCWLSAEAPMCTLCRYRMFPHLRALLMFVAGLLSDWVATWTPSCVFPPWSSTQVLFHVLADTSGLHNKSAFATEVVRVVSALQASGSLAPVQPARSHGAVAGILETVKKCMTAKPIKGECQGRRILRSCGPSFYCCVLQWFSCE